MNTDPVTGDTAEAALDRLHPDRPGRTPRIGSHADRLTGAGLALVAAMRVAPPGMVVTDANIDGTTGRLAVYVADPDHAAQLGARLSLPRARLDAELDDGVICRLWSGDWAGWPVTILHLRAGTDRYHARGAEVLAVVPR